MPSDRDHQEVIAALRRKAADPTVSEPERVALLAKATELSEKYGSVPLEGQPKAPFIYPSPFSRTYQDFLHSDVKPIYIYQSKFGGIFVINFDLDEDPLANGWQGWAPSEGE